VTSTCQASPQDSWTNGTPKERRGGSRRSARDFDVTKSVCDHIQSFQCRQSHYGKAKSMRSYLPPELSIKKMYAMWKYRQQSQKKTMCGYDKYRNIFCQQFNLSFGNPHQDTCSCCATKTLKMQRATGSDKQKVITELRLHKLKAKRFFQLMRQKEP